MASSGTFAPYGLGVKVTAGTAGDNGELVHGLRSGMNPLINVSRLLSHVFVCFFYRRIEKLLVADKLGQDGQIQSRIDPRTSGLLLLSTTSLRKYAETQLPKRSRLREGFLEDVADLEDPSLGREQKLRVLDRMWKSWGQILGWHKAAVSQAI